MVLANYKTINIQVDLNKRNLTNNEKKVLYHLVKAAESIDPIHWNQRSENGWEIRKLLKSLIPLAGEKKTNFEDYLEYLEINHSYYNQLDGDRKFYPRFTKEDMEEIISRLPQAETKNHRNIVNDIFSKEDEPPKGGNTYAKEITKEMVEAGSKSNRDLLKVDTKVEIKDGKLIAVPYQNLFKNEINSAKENLLLAASFATEEKFRKYLEQRAEALVNGEYDESDRTWIEIDGKLNIVIGPIETYIDNLMGVKGAYEAMVYIRDESAASKMNEIKSLLIDLEKNLPCPDKYKKKEMTILPIDIVETIYNAGETSSHPIPLAWILPNNDIIRAKQGSRIAISANISKAKVLMNEDKVRMVFGNEGIELFKKYEKYYLDSKLFHFALHEIGHSNGIVPDGIRLSDLLKENEMIISEAKADTLATYHMNFLAERKIIPREVEEAAHLFITITDLRMFANGINAAHEKGYLLHFNSMLENGAVSFNEEGKLRMDFDKAREAEKELCIKLIEIQAEASYEKSKELIDRSLYLDKRLEPIFVELKKSPVFIPRFLKPIF